MLLPTEIIKANHTKRTKMKKQNGTHPYSKDSLEILKKILTGWEKQKYNDAAMELKELKQRIERRIEWTESEIKKLSKRLQEYRQQLKSLEPVETIAAEYDLNEMIEEFGDLVQEPNIYLGKTQKEAVLDVLKRSNKNLLHPKTITAALKDGGYAFRTDDPLNSVYVLLNRLASEGEVTSEKTEDNGVCFKLRTK